jgi:sensor histidine kinase YesM
MKTDYRTALILSTAISLLLNAIFFFSFFYTRAIPSGGGSPRHLPVFELQRTSVNIASTFVLTFILYMLNFRIFKLRIQPRQRVLLSIGVSVVLTYFLSISISELQIDLFDFERPRARKGFTQVGLYRDYIIALLVILSAQMIRVFQKQQQTELEKETLHAEYMRSRYEALKNQVDPHFLFNSLNTLNSLIKTDSDKAQEYVLQLARVFRYTLQNSEVITLSEELEFTRTYCSLMQIRYGNNLNFVYDIDERLYNWLTIPLSLQTLVENAIKHNVVCKKQPLTITIEGRDEAIKVSNHIQQKKDPESRGGIGLVNLAERYRLMMKKEITINKTDTTFEVVLPLIKIMNYEL